MEHSVTPPDKEPHLEQLFKEARLTALEALFTVTDHVHHPIDQAELAAKWSALTDALIDYSIVRLRHYGVDPSDDKCELNKDLLLWVISGGTTRASDMMDPVISYPTLGIGTTPIIPMGLSTQDEDMSREQNFAMSLAENPVLGAAVRGTFLPLCESGLWGKVTHQNGERAIHCSMPLMDVYAKIDEAAEVITDKMHELKRSDDTRGCLQASAIVAAAAVAVLFLALFQKEVGMQPNGPLKKKADVAEKADEADNLRDVRDQNTQKRTP